MRCGGRSYMGVLNATTAPGQAHDFLWPISDRPLRGRVGEAAEVRAVRVVADRSSMRLRGSVGRSLPPLTPGFVEGRLHDD